MAWMVLVIAGLFEVSWALGLKYTNGFTRPLSSIFTVVAMIASMVLLERASRSIPIGTAYAVWTGIGILGAAVGGIILFGESRAWLRFFCIGLILSGIAGLKLLHE